MGLWKEAHLEVGDTEDGEQNIRALSNTECSAMQGKLFVLYSIWGQLRGT
jgi:hypothetical protein